MIEFFKNTLYPKYIIMSGTRIGNRAILFMGKNPIISNGNYDAKLVSFEKDRDCTYYRSNIYKRIYTFKQLIKWRRLLGKRLHDCLEYRNFKWNKITFQG